VDRLERLNAALGVPLAIGLAPKLQGRASVHALKILGSGAKPWPPQSTLTAVPPVARDSDWPHRLGDR
jgi:hypothetical protein